MPCPSANPDDKKWASWWDDNEVFFRLVLEHLPDRSRAIPAATPPRDEETIEIEPRPIVERDPQHSEPINQQKK